MYNKCEINDYTFNNLKCSVNFRMNLSSLQDRKSFAVAAITSASLDHQQTIRRAEQAQRRESP